MATEKENIVTPVALSKELGIKPQLVFAWVRAEKFPTHKCVCGHTYLQRDELVDFLAERDAKAEAKKAKEQAELEGKTEEAVAS